VNRSRRPFDVLLYSPLLLAQTTPVPATAEPLGADVPLSQHVHQVATYLTGAMETTAPSSSQPGQRVTVRMTTCAVDVAVGAGGRPSQEPRTRAAAPRSVWLYQEQALVDDLPHPYRQRFLEISASPYSQTVRSQSFRPAQPAQWVNHCSQPRRPLQPSDLGAAVCDVFLKPVGTAYIGNTPADGCPAAVRGATRITNHIQLRATTMETWDRGFDAQGKQVWGAKADAYQFRKIDIAR
jgi:hypothetical protein